MSKKLTRSAKAVAHHSPGRTRIKVPKGHRSQLRKIKEEILKQQGVKSVEVNNDTGSVLVKHDHELPIFEVLHSAIEAVGGDVLTTLIEGESAAAVEIIGPLGLAAAAFGILEGLGKAVFSSSNDASNRLGNLFSEPQSSWKTLVPAGFLLAAAYKAYETRMFWQGITPALLCYWAFDTYWKFNVQETKSHANGNGQILQRAELQ